MMGKPPPRPPGVARKPSSAELRMGNLRRELDAEADPSLRAAILYHMACVYEHELGNTSDAIEHYVHALAVAPDFQPASMARTRIAERTQPDDALVPILRANIAGAREPSARASGLVDLALRSSDWASLLHEALAESPEPAVPALILEWLADADHDSDALRDALRMQAETASDPSLRASLWLDLALSEIESGEIDVALGALDFAAECEALAWSARSLQRRTAQEHERWDAWVAASVAMATLLEDDAASDPLDLSVPMEEHLSLAAVLLEEAAMITADKLGDPSAASEYLDALLRLQPDDPDIRWHSLRLAELGCDADAITEASAWFREHAADEPSFVAHGVRQSLASPSSADSLDRLRHAAAAYPDSAYVQAAFDVVLACGGSVDERAERLQARAAATDGDTRAQLLWRAARLLAEDDAPEAAQALFVESAEAAERWKAAILRDALGAAIRARDSNATLSRLDEILATSVAPEEHALLAFCRYEVTRRSIGDSQRAAQLLRAALEDERNRIWAPQLARARAELDGDSALLGLAHEALATLAQPDGRAEHLLSAGRAYADLADWDSAERVLRDALDCAPSDRRIADLLEAVLRDGGRPEAVVEFARARAGGGERALLRAGATAERSGALDAAEKAYREALRQAPGSASAALALADVGRRQGDSDTWLGAYETLSGVELGGGIPELFALASADALAHAKVEPNRAALAYERGLEHPVTTLPSAVALLSLPRVRTSDEQRLAAEEILADAGAALDASQDGFAGAYEALRGSLGHPGSSAGESWLDLARLAPTDALRAGALLHGLRELRLTRGAEALDDLFILAQESAEIADSHPEAAIAIDEVLAPGDDAELRVSALARNLQSTSDIGRSALEAAHCRALVEADRGAEAVALLTRAIDARPDDLATWETLRGAARNAGEWSLVAQACERLAPFVEEALRADLLEEAGAVRLDHLGQYAQAEDAFRAALDADPTRTLAFRRLHDLLSEREDAEALEALVTSRLALGGHKERPELLYERARLLRGFSDRPGALEVLDELFTSEPDHVGALALAAEVHVSLERWEEAVGCLRRLSRSDIPAEQRRVAHLGAADFLESRLGRRDEALAELQAVIELGLGDVDTQLRIGSLEEGFGHDVEAIEAYQQALEQEPSNTSAAERLASLLEGEARVRAIAAHEAALWTRFDAGVLDTALLASLRRAAHWQGSIERASALAAVEEALDSEPPPARSATDLSHVSMAALWDRESESIIDEVIRRAGPVLSSERVRSKKLPADAAVCGELERLSQRFGTRFGSASTAEGVEHVGATIDRDGELHWTVPPHARDGLDPSNLFLAGRLAWAVPRGAGALIATSPERAAGTLAAVMTASRCRVQAGAPVLPAVAVKLRRAVRKSVAAAVGETEVEPSSILTAVERVQRTANRAGLLAGGDIGVALRALLDGKVERASVEASSRALDLIRFWAAPDSPLWGRHV